MKKTILITSLLILVFSILFAVNVIATNIASCQSLNSPGTYYLTNNILNYSSGTCLYLNSNNIILDCQGYLIDGVDSGSGDGIDNSGFNYVEIRNCVITDFFYGIRFTGDYGTITNNVANSNVDSGILLDVSTYAAASGNTANSNTNYGFWLYSSSSNTFTNNTANSNSGPGTFNGNGFVVYPNSNNNYLNSNTAIGNKNYGFWRTEI